MPGGSSAMAAAAMPAGRDDMEYRGGRLPLFELYHPDTRRAAAETMAAVNDRMAGGTHAVLILRHAQLAWILRGGPLSTCLDCFYLWRLHGWSQKLLSDAASSALCHRPLTSLEHQILAAHVDALLTAGADAGKVRRVDLAAGTATDHLILTHPECPQCASRSGTAAAAVEADLSEGAASARRSRSLHDIERAVFPVILDERTGLIRNVMHRMDASFLSTATALLYPFNDPENVEKGYGRSGRFGDDPVIAVIEALERFAGMRPRHHRRVVTGTYHALRDRAVDPATFILHAPEQYDEPGFYLAVYDPDREIEWVEAFSFRARATRLIPLQLAYFGMPARQLKGGCFVYEVSNGCAAGSSLAEAALFGLLEVIERDAFLTSWHSGRALQRIDPAGCPLRVVAAILARLHAEGLEVTVLDMGSGLPGFALAVKIVDRDLRWGPYVTYAAAADIQPEQALKSALQEAVTTLSRREKAEVEAHVAKGAALIADPSAVRTMADHAMQGWAPDALALRSFPEIEAPAQSWAAFAGDDRANPMANGPALEILAAAALDHCEDILLVDQSFAPLTDKGLRFAKILAPGLLPMTFGHCYRRLDAARLSRFVPAGAAFRNDPHVFL